MRSSGSDPYRSDSRSVETEVAWRRERAQRGGLRSLPSFILAILFVLMVPYWAGRALWRFYRKLRPKTP